MNEIFKATNSNLKINASNDVDMQTSGNTPENLTLTKGNNGITPGADDGEIDDDVDEKGGYKTKSGGKRIQRRGRDWDSPKKESIKKKKKQTKNNSFEMYVIKRPPGYVPEPIYP